MQITFPDNTTNTLNIFETKDRNAPVIIIFTAMGVVANYYRHYAAAMVGKGINIVTVDQRGNGASSLRPSKKVDFGYKEIVEVDYPHIIQEVGKLFPDSKKYIMGHSLGGQLSSVFVSKHPNAVDGLILNATCNVHYIGWDGAQKWGVLLGAKMCRLVASIKGYYPGKTFGFGGTEAKTLINDWAYTAETGKYRAANSTFDYEEAIQRVSIPVLALSYHGDSAAPQRSLDNLVVKFSQSAPVDRHHLVHPESPKKKYTHYSWVREPELSSDLVIDWIKKQA